MKRISDAGIPGAGLIHATGIVWTAGLHALAATLAWSGLSGPEPTVPVPIQVRFVEAAPAVTAPEPPKVAAAVPVPPPPVPETAPPEPVPKKPVEQRPPRRKVPPEPVAHKPQPMPAPVEPDPPAVPPGAVEDVAGAVTEAPAALPVEAPPPAAPVLAAATPAAAVVAPRFDADYLRNPAPAYPRASRRLGEQGRVVLRVCVEPDGRPSALEVHRSSGSTRLDEAALSAVRQWSFVAARRGSEKVTAWVLVPLDFRLKNG